MHFVEKSGEIGCWLANAGSWRGRLGGTELSTDTVMGKRSVVGDTAVFVRFPLRFKLPCDLNEVMR